jgi:uncharacterized membrane protein
MSTYNAVSPDKRDTTIDIVRGLAIMIMVGANMGPILEEPHGWFMRIVGSLAAPMFVLLAGMMVTKNAGKPVGNLLWRILFLLGCAAFTDMAAWGIRPFIGMDVLYLIAIGTLFTYVLCRLPDTVIGIIIFAFLMTMPWLQATFGYADYPTELELLTGKITVEVENQTNILHHFFIDGWFPLVPWLAYMLAGAMVAHYRWGPASVRKFTNKKFVLLGVCILVLGVGWWWVHPGAMLSREGFSEIFYPPTPGFFIASLGMTMLLLVCAEATQSLKYWSPVRLLGSCSLFVYVLHSVVIGRVFVSLWGEEQITSAAEFITLYAGFLLGLYLFVAAFNRLMHRQS